MFFWRKKKPDKLTNHERYVLRLYKKHGGIVGTQNFFKSSDDYDGFSKAVSVRVYVNGRSHYAIIPAEAMVDELARRI